MQLKDVRSLPKRARLDILTKLTLERLVNMFSEVPPKKTQKGEAMIAAEPCKRSTGTYRAFFETQEAAERFAAANPNYHGDLAHLCLKCGAWHLSSRSGWCPLDARYDRSRMELNAYSKELQENWDRAMADFRRGVGPHPLSNHPRARPCVGRPGCFTVAAIYDVKKPHLRYCHECFEARKNVN